jgi:nucleoside-diphosphate-sugar epimerase
MATLLVIGGSGFFGKSILDAYRRGILAPWDIDHVFILARNPNTLAISAPELLGSSITLIQENIATCEKLPNADFIIHAAASTEAKNYLLNSLYERENILAGTKNYCKLAEVNHKLSNIVYVSSGAVYGQQSNILNKITEEDPLALLESLPENKRDYAAAKRDAEELMYGLGKQGLNVSIARCFAFVGLYLPRNQQFAIGNFIENALRGTPITVEARHAVYRSYMYADDLVIWLMTIAKNSNSTCPVFNVGSNEAVAIADLGRMIASRLNQKFILPSSTDERVDWYVPCIKKAKSELGLSINYELDKAIDITIQRLKGT